MLHFSFEHSIPAHGLGVPAEAGHALASCRTSGQLSEANLRQTQKKKLQADPINDAIFVEMKAGSESMAVHPVPLYGGTSAAPRSSDSA